MKTLKQINVIFPIIAVFLAIAAVLCFIHPSREAVLLENITLNSSEGAYGLQVYEVQAMQKYDLSFSAVGSGNVQLCTDLYAGDAYDTAENDHYVPTDGTTVNVSFTPYSCSDTTYIRFILTGSGSVNISNINISAAAQGQSSTAYIIGTICAAGAVIFAVLFFTIRKKTSDLQLPVKKEIVFISNLRAFAALFVVLSHLIVFYASDVSAIFPWLLSKNAHTFGNDTVRAEDILLKVMTLTNVNFGAFGVSIFFLITGFCIMITFSHSEKMPVKDFVLKKLLRLYPVYIAGFGAGIVLSKIYSLGAGTQFSYSLFDCIMQVTLVGRLFGFASIDGLVWTLEVQLIFYILAYILYRFNLLDKPLQVLGTAFCMLILKCAFSYVNLTCFVVLADMISYLFIMFIGVCLYKFYSGKWSAGETFGASALLFSAHAVCQSATSASYFTGILLFITLMFVQMNSENSKQSKLVGFISQISYSLYASHALLSYNLLSYLNHKGIYPTAASLIVLSVEFIAAIALHYIVEKPCAKLMSRLSAIGAQKMNA